MGSTIKSALGMASVVAVSFFLQPYRLVVVRGNSMSPTLQDGEVLLARPMGPAPKRGDIVLANVDGTILIKRITRVPGDLYTEIYVKLAKRWILLSNAAQRNLVKKGLVECRISRVPDGQIFLEGDNPAHSFDSRSFGFVSVDVIQGLVVPAP